MYVQNTVILFPALSSIGTGYEVQKDMSCRDDSTRQLSPQLEDQRFNYRQKACHVAASFSRSQRSPVAVALALALPYQKSIRWLPGLATQRGSGWVKAPAFQMHPGLPTIPAAWIRSPKASISSRSRGGTSSWTVLAFPRHAADE